jgi:hypothetical protein
MTTSLLPPTPGLSDAFYARLADLGRRHDTDPEVFLAVWNMESTLNPKIVGSIGARGLNGMMPATLRWLGAPADFENLAAEDQLPWIEKLIEIGEKQNGGPFKTAARYEHSNFFPATMGRGSSPDTVVVARDGPDGREQQAYEANAALDLDHDGKVTLADLATWIDGGREWPRYQAARARLASAMRATTSPAHRAGPVLLGIGLALGTLAVAIWRHR